MQNSEKYLTDLYGKLGNLEKDFRNYNLTNLIISKVKGKSVLDIGCGNGYLLDKLSKQGKITFGIEPNKKLIRLAKNLNPELNIYKGDAGEINKLIKTKVDTVTMIDVLEHIKEDKLQIRKIRDCLVEKGELIIFVPANPILYGKRDKNLGHYRRYTKKRLISILKENNFRVKHLRHHNMLGVIPYFISEKILKKEMNTTKLRTKDNKKLLNRILNIWFKYVENNINLGFGFSLLCIAEKIE
ncbi:MAG: class I SAM-dependent methyltransferase [Nanoarchaeota archaeon]|nr:class I SAM-dependent methyltransferase [Nanoarchaeota archaeon]